MENKKYLLFPEVAGQFGEKTDLDSTLYPPVVYRINYEFDGWLGDDLIESFPCFICSERLTIYLKKSSVTGFGFKECEVTKSELFFDSYPKLELPTFYWFVVGNDVDADFYLLPNASLVVSENALDVLKKFQISHCKIEDLKA